MLGPLYLPLGRRPAGESAARSPVLLGLGTALVSPTLLAAVADVVHPDWRAWAVGVYRLWRDSGYALGALLAGVLADRFGISWAIGIIAGVTFLSGVVASVVMRETLPSRRKVVGTPTLSHTQA